MIQKQQHDTTLNINYYATKERKYHTILNYHIGTKRKYHILHKRDCNHFFANETI